MDTNTLPVISALWLGVLTSISPCPLASNIAAVSYISRNMHKTSVVCITGTAYTLGRSAAYCVLAMLISFSLVTVPLTAHYLQVYMPKVLGPLLIVIGLVMMGVVRFSLPGVSLSQVHTKRLVGNGAPGALLLGALFALSFCPVSAAFFFGSLMPLAVRTESPFLLPVFYGIGTGLPVLCFAIAVALGVRNFSRIFQWFTVADRWLRNTTGIVLIVIGIYFILEHIFYVQPFAFIRELVL